MRAEIRRMCALPGWLAVVGLVAAPLTAGISGAWLLFFACWLVSLVACLAYVAYEHVAYPRKSVSAAELFYEVRALQDAKARIPTRPRRRSGELSDIETRATASVSIPAEDPGSVFQWDSAPAGGGAAAVEIMDGTDEPAPRLALDQVELLRGFR